MNVYAYINIYICIFLAAILGQQRYIYLYTYIFIVGSYCDFVPNR